MSEIVEGTYGGVPIELDKSTGILKMAGKQGVLMRVRLINNLFGGIVRIPGFEILLHNAGIPMGSDYAISWLLVNKRNALPPNLQRKGSEYLDLQEDAEEDCMNPARLTEKRKEVMHGYADSLKRLSLEISTMISDWLSNETDSSIRQLWQEMHDEDVYAGWGRSSLTEFDRRTFTARVAVTTSFIARLFYYWDQQGKAGQKICSFLEGYFAGEAHVMFSRDDLACVETACRLEGADRCVFLIEPTKLLENPWI